MTRPAHQSPWRRRSDKVTTVLYRRPKRDQSWWLEAPRQGFTEVARRELPAMGVQMVGLPEDDDAVSSQSDDHES